jgi:hypothetical protein
MNRFSWSPYCWRIIVLREEKSAAGGVSCPDIGLLYESLPTIETTPAYSRAARRFLSASPVIWAQLFRAHAFERELEGALRKAAAIP